MITRRCTQRMLLLRPDEETNQTYLYVLGLAAERAKTDLIHAATVGNHEHVEAYDRLGTRVEFYQYLHELVARSTNALRGRFENFWSSEQTSVVKLLDVEDVIAKVVYAATNPVTAGLVERVHHWPGVNTLRALLDKKPITVKRPRHFFSEDMPEEVTLTFAIPPELGDADEILARIRARVAEVEAEQKAKRAGARVLGRRAVLRQSWRDRPRTVEPRFGLSPQVAAQNRWARLEALQRNRWFLGAYAAARHAWRAGKRVLFPPGTYWLRVHAGVPVADDPFVIPIRDPVVA
jgi:putative transposase